MNYNKLNNITGWAVFAVSLVVYLMTMASTASFWDCGEFIACANELEVPHPPGAPFYLILGRVFAIFAFGDLEQVSVMLNIMSALSGAFTVLFTFWIITHLAKKMIGKAKEELGRSDLIAIMGAGLVGSLACTFADSVWWNAVEAEVYAMSSLFTAAVVWLMFKWEERSEEPGNERWIILIAYLIGLSIGVHLLNLLTVPAIAFIYYFKKYDFSWAGFIATGLISVAILGIIQTGIILYTFNFAWGFEKFFVGTLFNNGAVKSGMGMPFGSGIIFFFLLLFGALAYGIYYSDKKKKPLLNIALMSVAVIYIGFSSYAMIPIRSNANPPIDENNPDGSYSFLKYMEREQYGDRPLLYGPLYNARPVDYLEAGMEYVMDEEQGRYREIGLKRKYKYRDADKKLFPRMYYDQQNRWRQGPHAYVNYVSRKGDINRIDDDRPTPGEDFQFFMDYQVRHMYWRYFMWNFAGKEGDVQDMDWESGLDFNKNAAMPPEVKNDPAKNHYYMLPFLFGLLGLYWQARKQRNDAIIIGLLFFFTGLAIVIYLNQYPMQPRERDYSFAGSFQTYAIWIGLAVIAFYDLLKGFLKNNAAYAGVAIALVAPVLMGMENWDDHNRKGNYMAPDSAYNLLNSLAPNAVLFTNGDNDTFPLWYIQEVENVRPDVRVLCLSYVNTDWYIDQMYQKVNQSDPLPLSLKREQYAGQENQGWEMGSATSQKVRFPVDTLALKNNGIVSQQEMAKVQNPMEVTVPTRGGGNVRYLELKDRIVLNLLENVSKSGWDRPVYFANTVARNSYLGLDDYLRLEGMAYRVTPVKDPLPQDPYDFYVGGLEPEKMFKNLTETYRYRNLDKENIYYDENARRTLMNYHSISYRLANFHYNEAEKLKREKTALQAGDGESAAPLLGDEVRVANLDESINFHMERAKAVMQNTLDKFPYDKVSPTAFIISRQGIMFDRLGMKEKAQECFDYTKELCMNALQYYNTTGADAPNRQDYETALRLIYQHYAQDRGLDEATKFLSEMDSVGININR